MGIDINPRQPIGIVCQALFVDPLLDVVWFSDPNRPIVLIIARINPVVGVGIDIVVVATKEDLLTLG